MNFRRQYESVQYEDDPVRRNAQSIAFIKHGPLKLMKLLQTKPQLENGDIEKYLFYTVILNLPEDEENEASKKSFTGIYAI